MNFAMTLDTPCKHCDAEDLVWWYEDETEDTMEVYVDCRERGYNYPKKFVSKSEDTSDSALENIARQQV